ncbi:MAG: nucleotidyl transferase AbiEii/AbiGii toxin family protein [Methylophilaceae bacterium]
MTQTVILYKAQDVILENVFSNLARLGIQDCILGGGTALARYYLNHRVSYDLDFFVAGNLSPERLSVELGRIGINLQDIEIESGGKLAHQLHGYANVEESIVKVSFIEDSIYSGMWPKANFGNVTTEEIGGLYHRKLRTISGTGYGKDTKGSRQTARDLFDGYVLNQQVQVLHSFIDDANQNGANFPQDAFCANLMAMPWIDLMDEFEGLELLAPYERLSLIGDIKQALINEAMIIQNLNELDDENYPTHN